MRRDVWPAGVDVSRETESRLETYAELLRKWQARINLVAGNTLADVWARHFADSAQLLPYLPAGEGPVVDLGSGAGFPGLVLAILGVPDMHLVESDQRKAAFLREAARVTATAVTIHATRIEALPAFPARAVTARALKPLVELIGLALPFLGTGLFLKGEQWADELTAARRVWKMRAEPIPCSVSPKGTILRVEDVSHAGAR